MFKKYFQTGQNCPALRIVVPGKKERSNAVLLKCSRCSHKLPSQASYCYHCGKPVEIIPVDLLPKPHYYLEKLSQLGNGDITRLFELLGDHLAPASDQLKSSTSEPIETIDNDIAEKSSDFQKLDDRSPNLVEEEEIPDIASCLHAPITEESQPVVAEDMNAAISEKSQSVQDMNAAISEESQPEAVQYKSDNVIDATYPTISEKLEATVAEKNSNLIDASTMCVDDKNLNPQVKEEETYLGMDISSTPPVDIDAEYLTIGSESSGNKEHLMDSDYLSIAPEKRESELLVDQRYENESALAIHLETEDESKTLSDQESSQRQMSSSLRDRVFALLERHEKKAQEQVDTPNQISPVEQPVSEITTNISGPEITKEVETSTGTIVPASDSHNSPIIENIPLVSLLQDRDYPENFDCLMFEDHGKALKMGYQILGKCTEKGGYDYLLFKQPLIKRRGVRLLWWIIGLAALVGILLIAWKSK